MLEKFLNELAYIFGGQRWDRRTHAEIDAVGQVAALSARIDLQRLEISRHGPITSVEDWNALQAGVQLIEQDAYRLDRLFFGNYARSHQLLYDLQRKLKQLQQEMASLKKPEGGKPAEALSREGRPETDTAIVRLADHGSGL
jgi:exonuclease VII small subunit